MPLHAQPRVCARKNILVIGGSKREHSADSWGRTAESTYETIEKYDIFTGYDDISIIVNFYYSEFEVKIALVHFKGYPI